MKRTALLLAGWLVFLAGAPLFGQARKSLPEEEARRLLKQMSAKLAENRSLSARFEQERRLALFDDTLRSRGVFFFRRPGRVRWEFVSPYASIIVMDENGRVERFDVAEGRLRRVRTDGGRAMGEVLSRISGWLYGDLEQSLRDFAFEMFAGPTHTLVLRPKSSALAALLSRIEFDIDPESFLVEAISLWESESDVTVIRFGSQRLNDLLDDALFDLRTPRILKPGEAR
ncbi:MAG: outer membrane lipoprotein carrier protein LolA [Candidatus Aminicenantes bacterium]|nr:outer membrane lipoprotein carrier protein LolA [Candidatus Aminicenantes bacterium]